MIMSLASTHVFSGPSLSHQAGLEILPQATFHAPIRSGDIIQLLQKSVQTIVIIDGVFESTPSIWHKEILLALKHGINVIGCSSMGALRAAELHDFGMQGHGEIFQLFASQTLQDDDELAVAHFDRDLSFQAYSDALINTRFTLQRAVREAVIDQQQALSLLNTQKQLFYWQRTLENTLARCLLDLPVQQRLSQWWQHHAIDQKRLDAVATLRSLSTLKPVTSQKLIPDDTIQSLHLYKQYCIPLTYKKPLSIIEKQTHYCLLTLQHVPGDKSESLLFRALQTWLHQSPIELPKELIDDLEQQPGHYFEPAFKALQLCHYPSLISVSQLDKDDQLLLCLRQQLWTMIKNSYAIASQPIHPDFMQQYLTAFYQLKKLQTQSAIDEAQRQLQLSPQQWHNALHDLARFKYLMNDSRLCSFPLTQRLFNQPREKIIYHIIQSVRELN